MSAHTRCTAPASDNVRVIVVMHPSDELYGADRVLIDVVERLRARDDVVVWLPTDVDYDRRGLSRALHDMGTPAEQVPLPVLRRAYANPRDVSAVAGRAVQMATALRGLSPDEVYVNTSALAPAVPIAHGLKIPTTLHIHETWRPFERRVLTPMCRQADVLITVSAATLAALPEVLRRRAVIRRHTVCAPAEDPEQTRALREAFAGGDNLVVYGGRWTPGKGIAELLAAVKGSTTHLVLLGGPPPSGEGVDVLAAIEAAGVGSQVHIVGEVDNVWPYIYASDAVAVPSIAPESYPTIALEALAAGRPVIASDIGGLPEIVTADRGWLIPPGDINAWARCLRALPRSEHLQQ